MTLLRAAALAGVLVLTGGCPDLAEWRDSNVQSMHEAAQSSRIEPPSPPIRLPAKVQENLPIAQSWTIISQVTSPADKGETVVALAGDDPADVAQWMVAELMRRGYMSHDNPSRILEGVEYEHDDAYYRRLYVHVTMNSAGQCVVTLTGWR